MGARAVATKRVAPAAYRSRFVAVACFALLHCAGAYAEEVLRVGSKRFTESYILGEILTQTAAASARVEHRQGLGNTAILFEALKAGSIDLYPEYLGTIDLEILKHAAPTSLAAINRELAPLGLGAAVPFGFNNSYALAIRKADSGAQPIRTISDLARHPEIRLGLSHEFLGRADGWAGLASRYRLPQKPAAIDHGIAYDAMAARQIDATDIYSTDAKIAAFDLRVLRDDLGYFPRYDALVLYRLDIGRRFPAAWHAIRQLEGRISEADMIKLNGAAELNGNTFSSIAQAFVAGKKPMQPRAGLREKMFDGNFWRLTRQHLLLVAVSLLAACAIGIPLGIVAAFAAPLRHPVMALVGVLQTIPALALLAMLIPAFGAIGTVPALIALTLYALLPVVRNTCIGIQQVPHGLRLAALALGLSRRERLLAIDLPLALPVMLAGIKVAAVTSVGTATIAAFIGAGGYGERIAIGLALNDNDMLLAGAIPAAMLALGTQWLFDLAERLTAHSRSRR